MLGGVDTIVVTHAHGSTCEPIHLIALKLYPCSSIPSSSLIYAVPTWGCNVEEVFLVGKAKTAPQVYR